MAQLSLDYVLARDLSVSFFVSIYVLSLIVYRLIVFFALIAVVDIAAHFSAKFWGFAPLLPALGDVETWSVGCAALSAAVLFAVLTVLYAILGDLLHTMLKSHTGWFSIA